LGHEQGLFRQVWSFWWMARRNSAFKARLEARGIPYSDFGKWAIRGWHQIFFYDPEGNVVEVHQADENAI